ncbi:GGDEF domain-containing protein [Sphingomonas carotinifaciens]|uniref:GGDEF domain-containing protein n=1 Tax=Sphingomonas carotinifaciens TaxID=1166323 RepID=UPI001F08358F|nr:diguanylate cyclase [Sphingomonas carotinifaciens]
MLAAERPATRLTRLAAWMKGDHGAAPAVTVTVSAPPAPELAPGEAIAELRRAADRETIARIAQFLCDNDLAPTEEHLLVARRYVVGEDRRLSEAINARVRDGQRITASFLDGLANGSGADRLRPEALAEFADMLNASLAGGFRTITRSCDFARDYGVALGNEALNVAADPQAAIERLVALTAAAMERTQDLAERLDATRRETGRLRSRLQAARRAAEEDHLTGLPNRRSFDARLHARPAEPNKPARCVALCDIDDFKRINDQHGHDTGDRVLKLVARHLKLALGTDVLVARHGGEEFACLFEGHTLHAARHALDGAREALGERRFVDQSTGVCIGRITFSAGIAPVKGDPREAMRTADAALYAAKRAGKDRVMVVASQPGV